MSATTDALANLIARKRSEALEHREEAGNYREQSDEAAKLALEAETAAAELQVLLDAADDLLSDKGEIEDAAAPFIEQAFVPGGVVQ